MAWDWELTDRDRRCGKKIQYEVRIDAFDTCIDHYERDGTVLVVYRCRYCRYWHVGNMYKGANGANWRAQRARLEKARRKRVARRELLARERKREAERAGETGRTGGAGTGRSGAPDRAAAPPGPAEPGQTRGPAAAG